jgi:hypothetical protein
MRIASYNVENLFERAVALSADPEAANDTTLAEQAECNQLLRTASYGDADKVYASQRREQKYPARVS